MEKNQIYEDVKDYIVYNLLQIGHLDLVALSSWIKDSGINTMEFMDYAADWLDNINFWEYWEKDHRAPDLNSVFYEYLFSSARKEIIEKTGKDITDDTEHQIEVFSNYLDSGYDYNEKSTNEINEIVKNIPEEERSNTLKYFLEQINL